MAFPPPSEKQARVFWFSLTGLAVAALIVLGGLVIWGFGWLANKLAAVIFPLAIATVLAYLLDPVVDFLQRRRIPRLRAILLVFFVLVMLVLTLLATVVPQLVVEVRSLFQSLPEYFNRLQLYIVARLAHSPLAGKARSVMNADTGEALQNWITSVLPTVGVWMFYQFQRAATWLGFLIGLLLVPVYLFYFLQEKSGIQRSWKSYLPLRDSRLKEEIIFILMAINDALIVFFRGQILVSLCTGTMLAIAFSILRLNYAILLGAIAAILGIVPYLGSVTCFLLAMVLAIVQFGDWLHPLLVLVIFGAVQIIEGFLISPKIIGDRVGLRPLTIIVAVLVGTTLMGGILGGVLAIPLTAALRTLMFRYVWKKRAV